MLLHFGEMCFYSFKWSLAWLCSLSEYFISPLFLPSPVTINLLTPSLGTNPTIIRDSCYRRI